MVLSTKFPASSRYSSTKRSSRNSLVTIAKLIKSDRPFFKPHFIHFMNPIRSKWNSISINTTTLSNLKKNPSFPFIHTSLTLLVAPFSSQTSFRSQHPDDSLTSNPHTHEPKILPFSSKPIKDSTFQTPISVHYVTLLKSCIAAKALSPGEQIHARLCVMGCGLIPHLGNKLVNLYCVCGSLRHAFLLFDSIPKRDIFLWNVVIRAFAWHGPFELAVSLYFRMFKYGVVPDKFTFPFVLKACSGLSAFRDGKVIHEHVVRAGCEKDIFVGAALIDMYAKCGHVEEARCVFDKIEERDVVLWNSMLAAYTQNWQPDEAFALCCEMAVAGVKPSEGTFITMIAASAYISALPQGKELHGLCWRRCYNSNDRVKTGLLDMYAKCGSVKVARNLFDSIRNKGVVSWNAMISGYAMHGCAAEALSLFEQMRQDSFPDHITFVGVLSACTNGGLLDEGRKYFELMSRDYGIDPTVQHYTCMVDLLGHCCRLDEARDLITQMNVRPDSGVWGALLNSCKIHGNTELAELALEKLIELEPHDAGNYVILSNMYAQAGKWKEVLKIRNLMTNAGIKKDTAYSWIKVKNKVHAFLQGDTSHPMHDEIWAELKRIEGLITEAGYVPDTGSVFHDVEDDEKTHMVRSHSERLAIAFGLISTPPGTRLLITKNLRICEDCHIAIKFISKVTEREITVRDVNRYHHFKDGSCSCGDYW